MEKIVLHLGFFVWLLCNLGRGPCADRCTAVWGALRFSPRDRIQRLYKDYTKTIQRLYKDYTKTIQRLYKDYTKTIQRLYKDYTKNTGDTFSVVNQNVSSNKLVTGGRTSARGDARGRSADSGDGPVLITCLSPTWVRNSLRDELKTANDNDQSCGLMTIASWYYSLNTIRIVVVKFRSCFFKVLLSLFLSLCFFTCWQTCELCFLLLFFFLKLPWFLYFLKYLGSYVWRTGVVQIHGPLASDSCVGVGGCQCRSAGESSQVQILCCWLFTVAFLFNKTYLFMGALNILNLNNSMQLMQNSNFQVRHQQWLRSTQDMIETYRNSRRFWPLFDGSALWTAMHLLSKSRLAS